MINRTIRACDRCQELWACKQRYATNLLCFLSGPLSIMDNPQSLLRQTEPSKHVIDDEHYKPANKDLLQLTIDRVLEDNNMFRLKSFGYNVGDCLFDSFQILLHMRYSSIEIRNGTIDHFLHCLQNNDSEALLSYKYELDSNTLYELHGLTDVDMYMWRMWLSATPDQTSNECGLWGDLFYLKWLSKWLNI
jgi:hypothetical protein